jgi:hypothetical protein
MMDRLLTWVRTFAPRQTLRPAFVRRPIEQQSWNGTVLSGESYR